MLIHTFEVKTQVTKELYKAIAKELWKRGECRKGEKQGEIEYYGHRFCGIRIRLVMTGKSEYVRYDVIYVIAPCRLLDPDNYLGLFDTDGADRVIDEIDFRLKSVCPLLPDIQTCDLSRVDYTVNAVMKNRKQVEAYVNFARQSRLPMHMKVHAVYDKKSKRRKISEDGYTVFTEKDYHNVEVTIYDKYREMCKENDKKNKPVFPEGASVKAKNVLRMEIRLKKHKINNLVKKHGTYSLRDFLLQSDSIVSDVTADYLTQMIPCETVRTLSDARKIIAESTLNAEKKQKLTAFVETVSVKRSTQKAIDAYKTAGKQDEAKKCMKALAKLDVNPIIAKEKTMVVFDGHVPTPVELWNRALSEYEWTEDAYVLRIGKRKKRKKAT